MIVQCGHVQILNVKEKLRDLPKKGHYVGFAKDAKIDYCLNINIPYSHPKITK